MQQARLAEQQKPLLELAASLQQLSRQPPVTVLAQPGSLRDMVHARAVLDAVMPVIERRTRGVRAELAGLRQTHRQQAVAPQALAASKTQLADRRDELTRLETEGRIPPRQPLSSPRPEAAPAPGQGARAPDIVHVAASPGARGRGAGGDG